MRIAIIAPGSRGDIQPYVALGSGLRDAGEEVRVVTHHNYETLLRSHGLEIWSVDVDVQDVVQSRRMRDELERGSLLTSMAQMAGEMKSRAVKFAASAARGCEGMDLLIAGIGGLFLSISIAQKTGLPLLQAYNLPFTPTRAFPGVLFPGLSGPGGALNRLSHRLTRQVVWQAYRPADVAVRRDVLGLPAAPFRGPFASECFQTAPVLYGFSPAVIPRPPDWDSERIHVTGYWEVEPAREWEPPAALRDFLAAGSPPVYIGFGSMSSRKPRETTELVLRAIRLAGQRVVLLKGWDGLEQSELPDWALMVDNVPHSWLFPRVAAVVHHGGAGTTAAGLRAGVSSFAVPFQHDQPFWGRRIHELGVGPAPLRRKRLTAEALAAAIGQAVVDQGMRERAAALGARIRAEDGIGRAVEVVQGFGKRHAR